MLCYKKVDKLIQNLYFDGEEEGGGQEIGI